MASQRSQIKQDATIHYVGQTSGLPVAVPLAPQGVENSVRWQIRVFPPVFPQNENC